MAFTKTAKSEYFEKLKSPMWQKKRLEVLQLADWQCESCGGESKTLHVHHKVYRRGREPWEYENYELQCLCEECHQYATKATGSLKSAFSDFQGAASSLAEIERCTGYLKAMTGMEPPLPDITVESYEEAIGVADAIGDGCTPDEVIAALDHYVLNVWKFSQSRKKA